MVWPITREAAPPGAGQCKDHQESTYFRGSRRRFNWSFSLIIACAALLILAVSSVQQPANAGVQTVTVSGDRILLDGADVPIKGFIFQTFVEDEQQLHLCSKIEEYCARHIEARDFYFGRGKYKLDSGLKVASDWGANTIRLNLNQAALDPVSPFYSQQYVAEITEAVSAARNKGFVVIVALFDGRNTNAPDVLLGRNPVTPLDNDTTLRAAKVLARQFGGDKGVMIELLNEPWSPTRRKIGWLLWRDGGTAKRGRFAGAQFAGVNAMIDAIRGERARNVIIVQGLKASFKGFPAGLNDPLNQIVYSVHPFFGNGEPDRLDWDNNFGQFAESHPFLVTAWNVLPKNNKWCPIWGINLPHRFLDYLGSKQIGIVAYALDVPHTMLVDFRKSTAKSTEFADTCAIKGAPGELVRNHFTGRSSD